MLSDPPCRRTRTLNRARRRRLFGGRITHARSRDGQLCVSPNRRYSYRNDASTGSRRAALGEFGLNGTKCHLSITCLKWNKVPLLARCDTKFHLSGTAPIPTQTLGDSSRFAPTQAPVLLNRFNRPIHNRVHLTSADGHGHLLRASDRSHPARHGEP